MNKVPNMISTKDLDYISDMINWNYTAAKKARHFANEVTDEEIKDMLERIYDMHSSNYKTLVDMLNEGGN